MTKRLGRGLADLIGPREDREPTAVTSASEGPFIMLGVSQIQPGKFQPRTTMSDAGLEELKASIRKQGVIEPIIVRRRLDGAFELVAGERRWRAAQAVGIAEIPAIVRTLSDKDSLEFALVENIQREELNPLEEARAFSRLMEEFGYTQDDVAEAVGKDRATIANLLRVLKLPDEIQQALRDGRVTLGHAKVLLGVEGRARQLELFGRVIKEQLSVRQLEGQAAAWSPGTRRAAHRQEDVQAPGLLQALRQRFGTKVHVVAKEKGGRIVIEYFSQEDLARLVSLLGVTV